MNLHMSNITSHNGIFKLSKLTTGDLILDVRNYAYADVSRTQIFYHAKLCHLVMCFNKSFISEKFLTKLTICIWKVFERDTVTSKLFARAPS